MIYLYGIDEIERIYTDNIIDGNDALIIDGLQKNTFEFIESFKQVKEHLCYVKLRYISYSVYIINKWDRIPNIPDKAKTYRILY